MALVCDVLMKFQGLNLTLILIAPWWLNQSWFADFLEFSIDQPEKLPVTWTPLAQPVGSRVVRHYRPQVLALTAWWVSSVSRFFSSSSRVSDVGLCFQVLGLLSV